VLQEGIRLGQVLARQIQLVTVRATLIILTDGLKNGGHFKQPQVLPDIVV